MEELKKTVFWRILRTVYQRTERCVFYLRRKPYLNDVAKTLVRQRGG